MRGSRVAEAVDRLLVELERHFTVRPDTPRKFYQINKYAVLTRTATVKSLVDDCPPLIDAIKDRIFIILEYRVFATVAYDPGSGKELWKGEHTDGINSMIDQYAPTLHNARSVNGIFAP